MQAGLRGPVTMGPPVNCPPHAPSGQERRQQLICLLPWPPQVLEQRRAGRRGAGRDALLHGTASGKQEGGEEERETRVGPAGLCQVVPASAARAKAEGIRPW